MAVRIKEGMIPYTGGVGIEITNNHVINLLLREANNLIHVNENNEVYVDLQLDDGILPDDDFPVGVTTGKILEEDGWQQSGLILNWKTTSGDYARLIYANDGNLYVDLGDGVRVLLGSGSGLLCNTRTFYLPYEVTDRVDPDLEEIQKAIDWFYSTKNPILWYMDEMYLYRGDLMDGANPYLMFMSSKLMKVAWENSGTAHMGRSFLKVYIDPDTHIVSSVEHEDETVDDENSYIPTNVTLRVPFMATEPSHPISLAYLNQELAKKQDVLTAGTRISIQVDPNTGNTVISADVSGVMTYKGNVTDPSALPSSGNTQGDCRYSESDGHLYAWDGTQWKDIGGTGINLNDYFNKTTDDSDDITEGSIHLFCTAIEKSYWDSKQDPLTAGNGIDITNNVISARYTGGSNISIDNNYAINNDAPFEPDNAGSMGQILQKTSNGYEWRNPNFVTSVNGQIGAVTVDEFDPDNAGTTGQVLKKTANGYEWSNETAGSYTGGTGINVNQSTKVISNALPFNPTNSGTSGQVLKLNQDGTTYSWQNESGGGGGGGTTYYGGDYITIDSSNYINNTAPFTPTAGGTTGQVLTKTSNGYEWDDIELPSGENNVKFWSLNTTTPPTSAKLGEIYQWVSSSANNGAVINDTETDDTFIFNMIDTSGSVPAAIFLGTKRNSELVEWRDQNMSHGYFTKQRENQIVITNSGSGYALTLRENPDDSTHTNYISALGAPYDPSQGIDTFMPTENWQPATKGYVDSAIAGAGGGNVSGPSSAINGNLAVFDGTTGKLIKDGGAVPVPTVISGVSGTTYTIQVANSDPASGTPATTITFVL